ADASGDPGGDGSGDEPSSGQEDERGRASAHSQPDENRRDRAMALGAAAADQRDGEREQAEHRENDAPQLTPAEAAMAHSRGDVGQHADSAGADALYERE